MAFFENFKQNFGESDKISSLIVPNIQVSVSNFLTKFRY